jgi:hypothetical protein
MRWAKSSARWFLLIFIPAPVPGIHDFFPAMTLRPAHCRRDDHPTFDFTSCSGGNAQPRDGVSPRVWVGVRQSCHYRRSS